jgi:hypothetical protein
VLGRDIDTFRLPSGFFMATRSVGFGAVGNRDADPAAWWEGKKRAIRRGGVIDTM